MQDSTSPHHLTPVDPRIAALEDHLARETRSSQALAARVKELEVLCAILGVVLLDLSEKHDAEQVRDARKEAQ